MHRTSDTQQTGWRGVLGRLWPRADREARTLRIVCQQGIVWVTCQDDRRDYFVRAGETLCLKAREGVISHGLKSAGEAQFTVESLETAPSSRRHIAHRREPALSPMNAAR